MSFDIFLLKFSKADTVCELPKDAFQRVLQKHTVQHTSERFCNIHLEDGSSVELYTGSPPNSTRFTMATFYVRGMSDSIVRLIFECAEATGGVLIPTMDQNPCILIDTSQRNELPPDFTQPLVECRSAAELARLLRGGYQAWSQYRDQVVPAPVKPDPLV